MGCRVVVGGIMDRTLRRQVGLVAATLFASLLVSSNSASAASGNGLSAETVREVQIAGTRGIPADATAIALNVTAVDTAAAGYATIWPCGQPRPNASNLNFAANDIVPNAVVVRPGTGGKVCFVASADADLLVDASGWFGPGDGGNWLTEPQRVLSTRDGFGAVKAPIPAGGVQSLAFPAFSANVTAAVINVTVTNTKAAGYLTVFPCGSAMPDTSTLNFGAGDTVANLAIVRPGTGAAICFFASATTDVIVDLTGSLTTGYSPLTQPQRLLDTRRAIGAPKAKLAADGTLALALASPPVGATAVLNVTVTGTDGPGYLTVRPCSSAASESSTLNFDANDTVANLALVMPGTGATVCLSAGESATDVIADLSGWLSTGFTSLPQPVRILDTRTCPFAIYAQGVTPPPPAPPTDYAFSFISRNLETGAEQVVATSLQTRPWFTSYNYSKLFLSRDCYAYSVVQTTGSIDIGGATTVTTDLVRINLRTGTETLVTPLEPYQSAVVVGDGPSGELLVSTIYPYDGGYVRRYSRTTGEEVYGSGGGYFSFVTSISADRTGRYLYSTSRYSDGRILPSSHLEELDTVTNQVRILPGSYDGRAAVRGVSPLGTEILVESSGTLFRVNLSTGERKEVVRQSQLVTGWTRDGRPAYVPTAALATIVAVNPDGSKSTVLTATSSEPIGSFAL
jgi:hypothetical protein